jgi:hypothetical protein
VPLDCGSGSCSANNRKVFSTFFLHTTYCRYIYIGFHKNVEIVFFFLNSFEGSGTLQRFGLVMLRTLIYRYMILRNEAFSKRLTLFRILVMSGPDQKLSFNETQIMNMLDQLKVVPSLKIFCSLLFYSTFTSFFTKQ